MITFVQQNDSCKQLHGFKLKGTCVRQKREFINVLFLEIKLQ